MTLGERIQSLRREHGMSQEALAETLGVSRQAVSKWEKGLSYPDTGNLLALAEVFAVSADELAGLRRREAPPTEEPERTETETVLPRYRCPRWGPAAAVVLVALAMVMILLTVYMAIRRMETGPVERVPSDVAEAEGQPEQTDPSSSQRPTAEETGEFALLWKMDGSYVYLAVGDQREGFPFGTGLAPSALETVTDTDLGGVTLHEVPCGDLTLTYLHWEEAGETRDTLEAVTTIVQGYETPRGIAVDSDGAEVLEAYGGDLRYLYKDSGSDILCRHDSCYLYAPEEAYGKALLFYIADGHVAGIEVRNADDRGNEAWAVDNETIFPIVDGQPDFSARQEPEGEQTDATQTVYIALQTLENDANLSAEEVYRCRQEIYDNLQFMSWQEFARLGEAGKGDETIFDLLDWLQAQDTLSESEIYGLQAGWCRTDLDGAYAESYPLGCAFIRYPVEFVHILADKDFTDKEREMIVTSTVWDAGMFPEECQAAAEELEHGLMLTDEQCQWQQAFLGKFREIYPDGIA